jgi:hypothetical protein
MRRFQAKKSHPRVAFSCVKRLGLGGSSGSSSRCSSSVSGLGSSVSGRSGSRSSSGGSGSGCSSRSCFFFFTASSQGSGQDGGQNERFFHFEIFSELTKQFPEIALQVRLARHWHKAFDLFPPAPKIIQDSNLTTGGNPLAGFIRSQVNPAGTASRLHTTAPAAPERPR